MKLISMTDFVLQESNGVRKFRNDIFQIRNYAKFLKQPLKLEMFVPCVNGEPLPVFYSTKWYKAKEKVLFEGFKTSLNNESVYLIEDEYIKFEISNKTIESLIYFDITLTPNATKQFL